jgi:sec-independent protein translocase protein TatA
MPNIGPLELAIVLVIALVIFGPKRLPDLGRSLGSGMREFKDSITGKNDDDDEPKVDSTQRELPEPQTPASESVEADVVSEPRR